MGLRTPAAGQTLFQTNGNASASTSSGCVNGFTLTPDAGNQAGSVWRRQQITLAKSFAINFSVYLGTKDGNGGDGMVFALQRNANGPTALGGGGQNMGMAAIAPSISVEFDTYFNNGVDPIADDHISLIKNGDFAKPLSFTGPAGSTTAVAAAVGSNGAALNIENGAYYPVTVTWNVKTKTLQVYFNGALRATYSEDLVSTIFGNNPLAYWGFTASTGGATNKMEACSLFFDYDQDSDGLTDTQDADDDNDGITDAVESGGLDATGDADADGVLNYQDADFGTLNARGVVAALDADGDGLINQFDLDADGDGIPDVVEGTDGQMTLGFRETYSAANGQYATAVSSAGRPQSAATYTTIPDTDADGKPDFLDTDSDGDAMPDWTEAFDDNSNGVALDDLRARAAAFVAAGGSSAFYPSTDTGNQGAPDWTKDSNSNGIPNFLDVASPYYHDTDGDGLVDLLDPSNLGLGYADVSGIPDRNANSLTDYRDAATATPLPVQLVAFAAQLAGPQVLVTWTTATELNNAYFVVEVSPNAQHFTALQRVAGAGTTAQAHQYRYTDVNPGRYGAATPSYYRLRQVDADGQTWYSAPQLVMGAGAGASLQAEPNPSSGALSLRLPGTVAGPATLVITGATGQLQLTQAVTLTAGTTTLQVPQAAGWPAGLYLVRVLQGSRQYSGKAIRE